MGSFAVPARSGGAHSLLTGLSADDHTQYALLAGRGTGQILIGGVNSGNTLTLQSTAHATRGKIFFGSANTTAYDEVNGRLGVGNGSPAYTLDVTGIINATSSFLLNGTSINTSGTLTNVAYLDTANVFTFNDANTNDIANILTLARTTSNTAANFFGSAVHFKLEDDAGGLESAALISAQWLDAAHGTRTARLLFQLAQNGSDPSALTHSFGANGDLTIAGDFVADTASLSNTSNQLRFSSGVTGLLTWTPTSTNKTLTLPDVTGTLATLAATETLLNKTLTAPTITGGTHTAITSLGIRDNSAAFDVIVAATSSTTLTASRTLTLNMGNVAHTLAFGTTANTITFPSVASDTVVMLAATQTLTNKTLTVPTINVVDSGTTGATIRAARFTASCTPSTAAANFGVYLTLAADVTATTDVECAKIAAYWTDAGGVLVRAGAMSFSPYQTGVGPTTALTLNPDLSATFANTVNATTFVGALTGNASTATALASARTLWGQSFDGSTNVTGSLTAVGDITGGASSMTLTAGTGNSRTLTIRTTTSGGTATSALTIDDTQNTYMVGSLRAGSLSALSGMTTAGDFSATRLSIGGTAVSAAAGEAACIRGVMTDTTGTPVLMGLQATISPSGVTTTLAPRTFSISVLYSTAQDVGTSNVINAGCGVYAENRIVNCGTIVELHGVKGIGIFCNASTATLGNTTTVAGAYFQGMSSSGAAGTPTITSAFGVKIGASTVSAGHTLTGQAGVVIAPITGATNNTALLIGPTSFAIPTGDWAIYNASTNANWLAGNLAIGAATANGQKITIDALTELTTIAAAATTDTTIQMPANSVVLGVSVRVTTVIPTATSFSVGDSGSATRFSTANVSTAANSTDPGTKAGAYYNATALSVRLTMNGGTPAANTGRVRVTIHYYTVTAPTS